MRLCEVCYVNSHNITGILPHFRKLLTQLRYSWDTVVRRLSLTIVYLCLSVLIMQSCKASGDKLLQFSMLKIAQNSAILAALLWHISQNFLQFYGVTFDVTQNRTSVLQNRRSRPLCQVGGQKLQRRIISEVKIFEIRLFFLKYFYKFFLKKKAWIY